MVILVAVALLVPLPSAVELRDWSTSMGPWFPLAFLAAHIVVTVLPFPRTAFTLAAGLLFGPLLGITLAVTASTASAMIALVLVRAAGWQLSRLVRHQAVDRVDARLRERGWLAVISLRLIPVVPFAPLNYAVGASGVRVLPYALATVAGLLPGTAAVVILGDALTGRRQPAAVSGVAVHWFGRARVVGVRDSAVPPASPGRGDRRRRRSRGGAARVIRFAAARGRARARIERYTEELNNSYGPASDCSLWRWRFSV